MSVDPILGDETRGHVSHYGTMSADRERIVRVLSPAVSLLTQAQATVAVTSNRTPLRNLVDAGTAMSSEVGSNNRRDSHIAEDL